MTAFPNAKVIGLWEATLRHAVERRFLIHAECDRCGHRAPLDAEAMARRFAVYNRITKLERHLVCMTCFAAGRPFRNCHVTRTEMDGSEYDKLGQDFARWQARGAAGAADTGTSR